MCAVGDTRQDKMEVDLKRNGQYQFLFISLELLHVLVNLTWIFRVTFQQRGTLLISFPSLIASLNPIVIVFPKLFNILENMI